MTLLEKLGAHLPGRYYLGVDVGYQEHVAGVISLQTFARGNERWKRSAVRALCQYSGGVAYAAGVSGPLFEPADRIPGTV